MCVDISSFFFPPPFEHKTKAGYVSQAADTKAPPGFALSSSALFSNLHHKSQTRTPGFKRNDWRCDDSLTLPRGS